jgi:hypothetical protein
MKANKAKQANPGVKPLRPINEEDYPLQIENNGVTYYRIWVRPKIIVYEISSGGYYLVPMKIKAPTIGVAEVHVEKAENNYRLQTIAK